MNRRALTLSIVALAMMAAAGATLSVHRQWVHLAPPGIRVAEQPIFTLSRTNVGAPPYACASNSVDFPVTVLDYASKPDLVEETALQMLPKDTTFGHRVYVRSNGWPVHLQATLMGSDRTSIHTPQFCLPGAGLQISSTTPTNLLMTRPHSYLLPVTRLDLRGNGYNEKGETVPMAGVLIYWFVADGQLTDAHFERALSIILEVARTGIMPRWAYVMCSMPCQPGEEDQAFAQLQEFLIDAVPQFQITVGPQTASVATP